MTVKPEYFNQNERRASFKTWIFHNNEPCSADKMAEAGFIYTGSSREPDSAQCFFCKKSLDGWESSDDPWVEHLKHGLKCDFAKMQKPQEQWTLDEWHELKHKFEANLIKEKYEELKSQKKKQFDLIRLLVSKPH